MAIARPIYPTKAEEASLDLNTWNIPKTEELPPIAPAPAPGPGPGPKKPSGGGAGLMIAGALGLAVIIGGAVVLARSGKKRR